MSTSHAKNYSTLLGPGGRAELAPLYDLMTALVWPNVTPNHAQDIGGQPRGRHIHARQWRRMAAETGLAGPATVRRVRRLVDRLLSEVGGAVEEVAAMPAGAGEGLAAFAAAIAERARLVGDHAATEGPAGPDAPPGPAPAG